MSSRRSGGSGSKGIKKSGRSAARALTILAVAPGSFLLLRHGRRPSLYPMKPSRLTISQHSLQQLIQSLSTHRVNTLTELCRIERAAASCDNEADARAFQEPMTASWVHYVTSKQFLTELRGLTRNYPFSGEVVADAYARVLADPQSNRSWNLAWLCLVKMREDGLVAEHAASQAVGQDMWGTVQPSAEEVQQLAACFEYEWNTAVDTMLRHWSMAPTWY
ncbi:hypothetical protein G7046_g1768 [Stylonectria norvegica]|nr:hypothetical protein G7046_g1768 [Stylonectria norvegica]